MNVIDIVFAGRKCWEEKKILIFPLLVLKKDSYCVVKLILMWIFFYHFTKYT